MFCFVLLYHIVNSSNFPTTYNRLTWNGPHSDMIDCCNSANTFLKLFEVLLLLVLVVLLGYLLVNWLSMISIPFQQEFDAWIFIFMVHRVLLFLQLIKRSAICAMEHKIKKKSHGTPVVQKRVLLPLLHPLSFSSFLCWQLVVVDKQFNLVIFPW